MRIPSTRPSILPLGGLLLLGAVLSGCGDEPQPTAATPAPVTPQSERERAIDNTAAASAVGYDGEGLKASVQRTVDTLGQQKATSQQAIDSAAGQTAADPVGTPAPAP